MSAPGRSPARVSAAFGSEGMSAAAAVPEVHGFDAELSLGDLFNEAEVSRWQGWLAACTGVALDIVAPGSPAARRPHAVTISHELEPLLALVPRVAAPLPPSLVAMFSEHVRERIRYRLASRLQTHASANDWAALQASEARYRALAADLERRVQVQVAELERARLYAFQAEHQRAVAQLAAGMAHEINNPIGFIGANLRSARGYLDELAALCPQADAALVGDFRALLQECADGTARVAAIVSRLRVFSQVDAAAVSTVRPLALVNAALALLAAEQPQGVRVQVDGDPEAWTCEAAALSQAVLQLLRNALQAMAGRTGGVQVQLGEGAAGRQLVVQDEGCGMDEAVAARACDPFYSTRDVGQGMGLGLSVAAEVARRHGGRLVLSSRVGQGTRVVLDLGPEPGAATGATA